jgi:hypothetical protein
MEILSAMRRPPRDASLIVRRGLLLMGSAGFAVLVGAAIAYAGG